MSAYQKIEGWYVRMPPSLKYAFHNNMHVHHQGEECAHGGVIDYDEMLDRCIKALLLAYDDAFKELIKLKMEMPNIIPK